MKNTNGKIKVHDSIIKELLESKEEFRDCISGSMSSFWTLF